MHINFVHVCYTCTIPLTLVTIMIWPKRLAACWFGSLLPNHLMKICVPPRPFQHSCPHDFTIHIFFDVVTKMIDVVTNSAQTMPTGYALNFSCNESCGMFAVDVNKYTCCHGDWPTMFTCIPSSPQFYKDVLELGELAKLGKKLLSHCTCTCTFLDSSIVQFLRASSLLTLLTFTYMYILQSRDATFLHGKY